MLVLRTSARLKGVMKDIVSQENKVSNQDKSIVNTVMSNPPQDTACTRGTCT